MGFPDVSLTKPRRLPSLAVMLVFVILIFPKDEIKQNPMNNTSIPTTNPFLNSLLNIFFFPPLS
jgi:hypothetical protein